MDNHQSTDFIPNQSSRVTVNVRNCNGNKRTVTLMIKWIVVGNNSVGWGFLQEKWELDGNGARCSYHH